MYANYRPISFLLAGSLPRPISSQDWTLVRASVASHAASSHISLYQRVRSFPKTVYEAGRVAHASGGQEISLYRLPVTTLYSVNTSLTYCNLPVVFCNSTFVLTCEIVFYKPPFVFVLSIKDNA
ncbi:hypothetical protein J6590_030291 [Homalodisca vitripennis]|nr:hypothetical protein J6590_030291 [Homalodisca vitripennis]